MAAAVGPGTNLTIALVDSGIDLAHPSLKSFIVDGVNLINPSDSPQDDNGHGTNVAGVIVSVAQKNSLASGIPWNIHLMPIKALESDGSGDEEHLGAGIKYAVEHGARIVVLSLGLNKYSTYLSDIVQNAEDQGVLLVSASGNEGNVVKYPAAYPTVLAVGGVDPTNKVESRSNGGTELDVVAPWKVYTTILGGGYDNREGTSMAAPQVAAVCALIWQKYPNMKPAQIRELIHQTAQDIGTPGWDIQSGYGLLRADLALRDKPVADIYESNNKSQDAKPLPLGKLSNAAFADNKDLDWYSIDAPYDGAISIQIKADPQAASTQLEGTELSYYPDLTHAATIYNHNLDKGITIKVSKGRSYIKLRGPSQLKGPLNYQINPQFQIAADPFEDNDSQFKAYTLSVENQILTGNFHQTKDQDWFMLPITQSGVLQLKLSVDTARIDPVLRIVKAGTKDVLIDQQGDGQTESSMPIEVTPGNYYINVSNVDDYIFPIIGQYML